MDWYYAEGTAQKGPVNENEFQQLVVAGVIQPSTLVWRDGLPEWVEWRTVRPAGTPAAAVPPPGAAPAAPGQPVCSECRKSFAPDELVEISGTRVCAACKPLLLQRLREGAPPTGLAGGFMRAGKFLVTPRDPQFPDVCVACGQPGDGRRVKRTLYWHRSWIYVLVLLSLWIYIIVALLVRKKTQVQFSVCPIHRRRHAMWVAIAWASLIAFIGCIVGVFAVTPPNTPWIGFGILPALILLLVAARRSRYLWAKEIEEDRIRIAGVGEAVLQAYPPSPEG